MSTEYFLNDALGSVRQLTNQSGAITYAKAYDPYGVVTSTSGTSSTAYGFTGEQTDASGLTYLRARYYASDTGRFLTRVTWGGDIFPVLLHQDCVVKNYSHFPQYAKTGSCKTASFFLQALWSLFTDTSDLTY